MRAIDVDDTGYYHARWDRATPLEVIAETKKEAINKAAAMLGPEPHGRGWSWRFITDSVEESGVIPTASGEFAAPPLPDGVRG
jgi:hypothetical protein